MTVKETDDIWRLYRREWVTVHTVTESGVDLTPAFKTAQKWVLSNLTGRVRNQDITIEGNTDGGLLFWCHIKVFKENLKGEFKFVENAQVYATRQNYDEYVIVPRNSKSDHDIRSYGVRKL